MRLVIALGGNALLKRGEVLSAENQWRNMQNAAASLAQVCDNNEVAIVHGNGPQVGLLALEADAYKAVPPYPLDMLGAESQGMIGYVIAQVLRNMRPGREIASLLTQTVVDMNDPAFKRPTKPIGPIYTKVEADALQQLHQWDFAPEANGVRRIVASPKPISIVELPIIKNLINAKAIVICAGGGGIPVRQLPDGQLQGVEAVIDKDFAAAMLSIQLRADNLIILTDVDAVYQDWGTPNQQAIRKISVDEVSSYRFAEGSMAPKVEAACVFANATGRSAFIGSLSENNDLLSGKAGTEIFP